MTKFLAGILSVIAVGILLIAYGLLTARQPLNEPRWPGAGPVAVADRVMLSEEQVNAYIARGLPYAVDPRVAVNAMPHGAAGYVTYPGYVPAAVPIAGAPGMTMPVQAVPVQTVVRETQRPRPARRVVEERAPRRNWVRTAAVIGGSSAAGAGIGAIVGGKKGALVGAAIGGGASTIYEVTK